MTLEEHKALQLAIAKEAATAVRSEIESRCSGWLEGPPIAYFRVNDGFITYDTYRPRTTAQGDEATGCSTPVEAAIRLKRNLEARAGHDKIIVWRRFPDVMTDGLQWYASARCAFVDVGNLDPGRVVP